MAIWFDVTGDERFLSHRDTMRVWQRALVRVGAPVSYSEGFNPHMRLSLPLPRSVGMASQAELLTVQLERPCEPQDIAERLRATLPSGVSVKKVQMIRHDESPAPRSAQYRVELSDSVDEAALAGRIERFNSSDAWPVDRPGRKGHKARTIDLKASVGRLSQESRAVTLAITIRPEATARVDEVLAELQIADPLSVECVTRTGAEWRFASC